MPLAGIKVLDMTQHAFGPRASASLAEMGAEVIKIENAAGGDPTRGLEDLRGVPVGSFNPYYEQNNRGKRSIALNLRADRAREVAHKLVEGSDVFVTNIRLAALERLGMDYETLSRINPGLIYTVGTGWGLRGPARDRGAFEAAGFTGSAFASSFAEPGSRPPLCPPAAGDYMGSMFLAYGTMLALFHRQRTGEGQMVHASLFGSFISLAACCVDVSLAAGEDIFLVPHEEDGAFYSVYKTRDGRWIQLALVRDERSWVELCEVMEMPHLMHDPRFESAEARTENNQALIAILDEAFLTRDQREWVSRLERYNFPWAPVRHFTELGDDRQALENGYIVTLDDPQAGEVKVAGVAVELSKTPGRLGAKAPELGQHTEDILLELGYSWEDIAMMKEEGAIL